MREVASVCPGCGARSYVPVDAWAGSPDSARDGRCADCRRLDRHAAVQLRSISVEAASDFRAGGSSVGPTLLLLGLFLAPLIAAVEIALR